MLQNKKRINQENYEDSPTKIYQDKFIFKKYKIIQKISDGTFGKIYSIKNNDNKYFIMKTERNDSNFHLLEQEAYYLYSIKGFGIPKLITFGKSNNYTILIEQYLGKSLSDILTYFNDKLTIQEKCFIAIQLIERIEYLHSKKLIHRDLKPDNFLLGIEDPNIIYLTEFRFCSKFKSSKTGKHIKPGFKGTFTGSLRFSSANSQRGMQQSRRDDLESIGYVILLCFRGKLPWDLGENFDWNSSEKDIYLKTYKMKKFIPYDKLCKDCPNELEEYFKYVRGLKFEEEPDYQKLRNIFIDIIKNNENVIENEIDINKITFSLGKQLGEKSRYINKKNPGIKSRLYHKILQNFENRRLSEITLENISNQGAKAKNILNKKSTEYKPKFNLYPVTQENYPINNNNLIKINKNNSNGRNNLNNFESFENNKKIKNDIIIKNNYLTIRESNQNKNVNDNLKYLLNSQPSLDKNTINKNNNTKINNYIKISKAIIPNNVKRNINNNNIINLQKKKLNQNMNNKKFNLNNQINPSNNRPTNNSQNIRSTSNNLNNKILRRQINLNLNNYKVNLTNANLENQYKPIMLGNKNGIFQQNINYNKIYINSNSYRKNLQNNCLLNKYQTDSSDKNYNNYIIYN